MKLGLRLSQGAPYLGVASTRAARGTEETAGTRVRGLKASSVISSRIFIVAFLDEYTSNCA